MRHFLASILLSSGCITQETRQMQENTTIQSIAQQTQVGDAMEKVSFRTSDGVRIAANYWTEESVAVLLLHMMPSTKESWNEFAKALSEDGFSVLAIDLRGHGESTQQDDEILDYRNFNDEQHQQSIKDVEASVEFLKQKDATTIYLAGASIGANLALWFQAEHPEIKKSILLSAGLNYRGIKTLALAEKLRQDQQVFLAAGTMDDLGRGNAVEVANQVASPVKGRKQVKAFESSAHGTDLFKEFPELIEELVNWLKS